MAERETPGQRIRNLREAAFITQKDFAERIGVAPSQLSRIESGETKTISFPIDVDALKFWNQQMKYDAEPGKFNVFIGVDSARVKQGEFELL